jgi:hypothetical protein
MLKNEIDLPGTACLRNFPKEAFRDSKLFL